MFTQKRLKNMAEEQPNISAKGAISNTLQKYTSNINEIDTYYSNLFIQFPWEKA